MIRRGYVARTWVVPDRLAQDLRLLSDELQVPDSHVVTRLLQHAMTDVETGRLVLRTRVTACELIDADP